MCVYIYIYRCCLAGAEPRRDRIAGHLSQVFNYRRVQIFIYVYICVFISTDVCVRARACVCVYNCVCERVGGWVGAWVCLCERERVCVCEREWVSGWVGGWVRECVCVCECMRPLPCGSRRLPLAGIQIYKGSYVYHVYKGYMCIDVYTCVFMYI